MKPLPDLIHSESTARQRESNSSKTELKIMIKENLLNTWLGNPPSNYTSLPGDTIHVWPVNTKYPTCDKFFVPEHLNDFMPHAMPFHIDDVNLDKFLNSNAIVSKYKALVDPRIFNTAEVSV